MRGKYNYPPNKKKKKSRKETHCRKSYKMCLAETTTKGIVNVGKKEQNKLNLKR